MSELYQKVIGRIENGHFSPAQAGPDFTKADYYAARQHADRLYSRCEAKWQEAFEGYLSRLLEVRNA